MLSVVDKEYIEVYWGDVAVVVDVAVGVVGSRSAAVPFSSKRNQKRVQVLGFNPEVAVNVAWDRDADCVYRQVHRVSSRNGLALDPIS